MRHTPRLPHRFRHKADARGLGNIAEPWYFTIVNSNMSNLPPYSTFRTDSKVRTRDDNKFEDWWSFDLVRGEGTPRIYLHWDKKSIVPNIWRRNFAVPLLSLFGKWFWTFGLKRKGARYPSSVSGGPLEPSSHDLVGNLSKGLVPVESVENLTYLLVSREKATYQFPIRPRQMRDDALIYSRHHPILRLPLCSFAFIFPIPVLEHRPLTLFWSDFSFAYYDS